MWQLFASESDTDNINVQYNKNIPNSKYLERFYYKNFSFKAYFQNFFQSGINYPNCTKIKEFHSWNYKNIITDISVSLVV